MYHVWSVDLDLSLRKQASLVMHLTTLDAVGYVVWTLCPANFKSRTPLQDHLPPETETSYAPRNKATLLVPNSFAGYYASEAADRGPLNRGSGAAIHTHASNIPIQAVSKLQFAVSWDVALVVGAGVW